MEGLKPLLIKKWSELFELCKKNGIDIGFVSGYRSPAEQDKLYAQGRTTAGNIVTQAKGGSSLHNFGISFDCVIKRNGQPNWNEPRETWLKMGELGKSIGLEHGDRGYEDLPHFQIRFGYSLADFQNNKVDWSKWEVGTVVPVANPNKWIDDMIAVLNTKRV